MTASRSLELMRNIIHDSKYVCMFGVGVLVKECFPQLVLSIGRQPDFFCDNAPEKWGTELFSIKCLSPAQLGDLADDTVVVITVKSYEAISRQLYGMGIKHVFAVFFDRSYNSVRAVKKIEKEQSSAPPPALGSSPLRGKWTLITGASRGAGRQIALAMAGLGSNIIAHSRCVSHVSGLVHECSALGVEIAPIVAELSNPDQLETMLSELEHLVPRVDIIFNNAAIPCQSGFWSSPSRDYLECYAVNAVAPIRICRQLIPPMIERGYGRVVNVTSSVQKRLETMAYACSKAALDKFVHDLAPSLEGTGVAISLVDPGWLRTDMTGFDGPHAVESIIPGVLLGVLLDGDINGRWFTAQDYAGLSIEAAMEKAKFVFDPIGVQNLDHAVQEAK